MFPASTLDSWRSVSISGHLTSYLTRFQHSLFYVVAYASDSVGGCDLEHGLSVGKRQGKNDFVINVLYGLSVVLSTWEGDLT